MIVNRLSRQRADDILLDFLRALIARAVQYRIQRLKVAPGGGLQRTANQGRIALLPDFLNTAAHFNARVYQRCHRAVQRSGQRGSAVLLRLVAGAAQLLHKARPVLRVAQHPLRHLHCGARAHLIHACNGRALGGCQPAGSRRAARHDGHDGIGHIFNNTAHHLPARLQGCAAAQRLRGHFSLRRLLIAHLTLVPFRKLGNPALVILIKQPPGRRNGFSHQHVQRLVKAVCKVGGALHQRCLDVASHACLAIHQLPGGALFIPGVFALLLRLAVGLGLQLLCLPLQLRALLLHALQLLAGLRLRAPYGFLVLVNFVDACINPQQLIVDGLRIRVVALIAALGGLRVCVRLPVIRHIAVPEGIQLARLRFPRPLLHALVILMLLRRDRARLLRFRVLLRGLQAVEPVLALDDLRLRQQPFLTVFIHGKAAFNLIIQPVHLASERGCILLPLLRLLRSARLQLLPKQVLFTRGHFGQLFQLLRGRIPGNFLSAGARPLILRILPPCQILLRRVRIPLRLRLAIALFPVRV